MINVSRYGTGQGAVLSTFVANVDSIRSCDSSDAIPNESPGWPSWLFSLIVSSHCRLIPFFRCKRATAFSIKRRLLCLASVAWIEISASRKIPQELKYGSVKTVVTDAVVSEVLKMSHNQEFQARPLWRIDLATKTTPNQIVVVKQPLSIVLNWPETPDFGRAANASRSFLNALIGLAFFTGYALPSCACLLNRGTEL